jgi:hypothetical protein
MVRGGSLLILRFVGQRSRSQLLKIEQTFDIFFVSAQYLKYKKLSTHMPHVERNKSHEQLGFRTFGALLIFIVCYSKGWGFNRFQTAIFCSCPKPGAGFPLAYVIVFFVFNGLRWEVVVCFVDLGWTSLCSDR